jgi:hypothetical protein
VEYASVIDPAYRLRDQLMQRLDIFSPRHPENESLSQMELFIFHD